MKKKLLAFLLTMIMAVGLLPAAGAAALDQVVYAGGSALYNANGQKVNGTDLGANGSVVKISKTIEQYQENGVNVENEFVVTLQVQAAQNLLEIASDTPDSAVLLVMDVSNSMEDCVECGEAANHTNHTGTTTTTYYCRNNSGNVFTASYLNNQVCRHCGQVQNRHRLVTNSTPGSHTYQTRLAATKAAANDFLYEFANETGAQEGDRRMVAIVAYGTHAVRVLDWTDITTTTGMYDAQTAVNSLTIANNNQAQARRGGGTSIESGLALGRNLLDEDDINGIDYRYTILLTDGQPTYPSAEPNSTRTSYISGSTANSGSSTQESDMNDVAAIADTIINTHKSKLYSICFGKVDGEPVWGLKPFGNWSGQNPRWSTNQNTTVGQWLGSFSTAAYQAQDASAAQLFDTFSSILAQIQVAAKAWKVEDWMGEHMMYVGPVSENDGNNVSDNLDAADYNNNAPAFLWDLLTSHADTSKWNFSQNTGVLSYTYQYRAKLDNLDTRYSTTDGNEENPSNAATDANNLATLRYATTDAQGNWPESTDDYQTANFPVPQVQGLVGELTFRKVDEHDNPIENITFRLRSKEHVANPGAANEWAYVQATSDANGMVTFTGIPSGHEYILLEAEKPDYYEDLGDLDVSISWSEATISKGGSRITDTDEEGNIKLVNHFDEDDLGKLTIKKKFAEGSEIPASIQFKITGPNNYTAQRELNSADLQADGTWTWTMTGLHFGEYTIQEINAVDEHGNLLRNTHDLEYAITVDGVEVVEETVFDGANLPEVEVEIKSTDDRTVIVQFTNSMTRKQGKLSITKSFVDLPASMVNANMGLTMKVTATPVDVHGAPIAGESPVTLDLVWNNGAYTASKDLPIGRYKLTEELSGTVPGYSLLHYVFEQNGANIENGIVTIEDDETLSVTLKNHYEQDMGRIVVLKRFAGDLDAEYFEENLRVFHINIYKNDANGELVDTIVIDAGDGRWAGQSKLLPVGTYYVDEVVAQGETGTAFEPDYTHTVQWSGSQTIHLTDDALVGLALTNHYDQQEGYLRVSKVFAGLPEALSNNLTITITVKDAETDETVDTLTLVQDNDWTENIMLPVGAYKLEESGAEVANYALSAEWSGLTNGVVVITAENTVDARAAVTLTNTYVQDMGFIQLTKAFAGDLTAADFAGKTITVDIMSGNEVVNTLTLTSDHLTATSDPLPVGDYQLVESGAEVADYDLTQTWVGVKEGTLSTVTVAKNATAQVQLTNTYDQHKGGLTVSKTVVGAPANVNDTFTFTVTFKDASGNPIADGEYGDMVVANGAATVTLTDGQSVFADHLPVGTVYTVTEQEHNNYVTSYTGATGTIAADTTAAAAFTNTYKTGGLTVTKTVEGNGADPAKMFTFMVMTNTSVNGVYGDMTFENGVAIFQLAHGMSKIAVNLPVGINYSVVEQDNEGYTVTSENANGVIAADGVIEVHFINNRTVNVPETGDNAKLGLWFALLTLSMAGIAVITLNARKKAN